MIIERLGKFNRIVNAGFHVKVPVIDRKAATVSLRTMKNGFGIDVKTQDNVTIGLEVSAQYHVSYDMAPARQIRASTRATTCCRSPSTRCVTSSPRPALFDSCLHTR